MIKREEIEQVLNRIEAAIQTIDQNYEKYFSGIERRPPEKARDEIGLELRRLSNRYIPQTDLRYRYQMLATRYHSYYSNWERLMRQIEDGTFVRKLQKLRGSSAPESKKKEAASTLIQSEAERISAEIAAISGKVPDRQKIATLLAEQRAQLSSRFAGRDIEFVVTCEDGKPKLKARPKV